jgi:hypothetical protein
MSDSNERARIDQLERVVGELQVLNQALVKVLKEAGVIDGRKLLEVMQAIQRPRAPAEPPATAAPRAPEPPAPASEGFPRFPVCSSCGERVQLDEDTPPFCYYCGASLEE